MVAHTQRRLARFERDLSNQRALRSRSAERLVVGRFPPVCLPSQCSFLGVLVPGDGFHCLCGLTRPSILLNDVADASTDGVIKDRVWKNTIAAGLTADDTDSAQDQRRQEPERRHLDSRFRKTGDFL